ncbi:hypothetical protein C8Q79DRAFT_1011900 [Trametes meyenii]|nr:hypothetical protein C8Q79DRAFT_1011900 [Trametes meyenii]
MAEPQLTPNASSSSSSHKRSYDAIGPEGGTNRSDVPPPGRSRRGSPTRSPSSAEGSRERNKRARNDRDSSYTSEVEDLLLSTGNPVSPSSSGSSRSSYHSAHSTLPTVTSPSLHDAAEDGMLVDPVFAEPVLPEPRPPSSASAVEPPWAETVLPVPHRRSPMSTSDAVTSRETRFHTFDEFRRSLERVNAFDREIAPLRSSPTAVPTTTSRNTGPLPPVQLPPGLDDELQARSPYVPDPAHAQFIDIDFDEPPREVWASSTHSGRANGSWHPSALT